MSPIPTNPRQSLKNRKNTCFCPASPASTLLYILWQITLSVAATPQFPSHRTQGLEGASSLERPKKKIKKSEKKDKDKKKTKKKKSSSHWLHEVVSLALAVRFAWLYRPSVCCESEAARTQTPRLLAETPRSAISSTKTRRPPSGWLSEIWFVLPNARMLSIWSRDRWH